jgi:hypothetical protein
LYQFAQEGPPLRYVLHGTVYPEREDVWGGLTPFEGGTPDRSLHLRASWSISGSKVTATVDVLAGELHVAELRNTVARLIRRHLDCIGFNRATGYELDLYSVLPEGEQAQTLGVAVGELFAEAQAAIASADLYAIAVRSEELTRALEELRKAIREPHDTAFHCYRAIEALRAAFARPDLNEGEIWAAFRGALRVDRASLIALGERSKRERHGALLAVTTDYRISAMRLARAVVLRYVAYVREGNVADDAPMVMAEKPVLL